MKKSYFVISVLIVILMLLTLNASAADKPITLIFTSHNSGTGFWKTNSPMAALKLSSIGMGSWLT